MVVTNSVDVDRFITIISEREASDALIYHRQRAKHDGPVGLVPDHDMSAGVKDGWGYISYVDPDHELSTLAGDPQSPEYHGENCYHPAGSGVRIESFRSAIVEFLDTARRPRHVNWLQ
ncbi:Imm1 family immunity protein [Streptomyces anulatus]|uniref:Imm1 family immunity protein n=1 Tax=Streptomyces anulatus TaxID=1892 RepID=UPI00386DA774